MQHAFISLLGLGYDADPASDVRCKRHSIEARLHELTPKMPEDLYSLRHVKHKVRVEAYMDLIIGCLKVWASRSENRNCKTTPEIARAGVLPVDDS